MKKNYDDLFLQFLTENAGLKDDWRSDLDLESNPQREIITYNSKKGKLPTTLDNKTVDKLAKELRGDSALAKTMEALKFSDEEMSILENLDGGYNDSRYGYENLDGFYAVKDTDDIFAENDEIDFGEGGGYENPVDKEMAKVSESDVVEDTLEDAHYFDELLGESQYEGTDDVTFQDLDNFIQHEFNQTHSIQEEHSNGVLTESATEISTETESPIELLEGNDEIDAVATLLQEISNLEDVLDNINENEFISEDVDIVDSKMLSEMKHEDKEEDEDEDHEEPDGDEDEKGNEPEDEDDDDEEDDLDEDVNYEMYEALSEELSNIEKLLGENIE